MKMKIGENIIQELIKDKDVISATTLVLILKNIDEIGDLEIDENFKKFKKK